MTAPPLPDRALIERYDRPGPRYTSYPTAPCWNEGHGGEAHAAHLRAAGRRHGEPLSLYVHLPYCASMCWFCGCSVVISKDRGKGTSYVDDVLREADLIAAELGDRRPVVQHHWGGGTPTFLPAPDLVRLFEGLKARFPHAGDAEISLEVDPRVTTREQLEALRSVGFNRLSMGVQDFDPAVQEAIHRFQSRERTERLIADARELGIPSVNVDLVYGLPRQTREGFGATLDRILALRPERVACYGYAHVPWAVKNQRAIDENALPDREARLDLYLMAYRRFTAAGYVPIGMDHFARADDPLGRGIDDGTLHRNFMGYTTWPAQDMVALGATAISEVDGAFAQNQREVAPWREEVRAGRLPTLRGLARSADDEARRAIILDLMCRLRLRWDDHGGEAAFRERYAVELGELEPMVADGMLTIGPDGMEVTDLGRLLVRNVCMVFDAWLRRSRTDKPVFSRTV